MTARPIMPVDRDEVSALRARVKELESRVAELERRLSGATGGYGPPIGSRTVYSIPDGCYFENGKALYGGRGGGGQG